MPQIALKKKDFQSHLFIAICPLSGKDSPLTSCEPASVKSELMISSKLQPGSAVCGSCEMCRSIVLSTSSSDASSSCSRMLALSRKPSRSLWALTSSSKFISFTYWYQKQTQQINTHVYLQCIIIKNCIHHINKIIIVVSVYLLFIIICIIVLIICIIMITIMNHVSSRSSIISLLLLLSLLLYLSSS